MVLRLHNLTLGAIQVGRPHEGVNLDLGAHRKLRKTRRTTRRRTAIRRRKPLGEGACGIGERHAGVVDLAQHAQEGGLVLAVVVIPLGFVLAAAREQILLKGRQPVSKGQALNERVQ